MTSGFSILAEALACQGTNLKKLFKDLIIEIIII
jgi:hypothetical protein